MSLFQVYIYFAFRLRFSNSFFVLLPFLVLLFLLLVVHTLSLFSLSFSCLSFRHIVFFAFLIRSWNTFSFSFCFFVLLFLLPVALSSVYKRYDFLFSPRHRPFLSLIYLLLSLPCRIFSSGTSFPLPFYSLSLISSRLSSVPRLPSPRSYPTIPFLSPPFRGFPSSTSFPFLSTLILQYLFVLPLFLVLLFLLLVALVLLVILAP